MQNDKALWQSRVRQGIRVVMYQRGISVAEMARRLDVPPTTLWRMLKGERPFRKPYAVAIAYELSVPLERLAEIGSAVENL